jgi:flagella basal body P-ring formation protein FlgA
MAASWVLATAISAQLAAVHAELETALRAKYPQVTRVEIAAFDAERAAGLAAGASIARLGARSALADEQGRLVWFAVRGYSDVVILARTLPARADLGPDDLALAEREVVGIGCTPLRSTEIGAGHWLRRGVRGGEVLCREAIEQKPPVVRGAEVAVAYSAARVHLSTTARAEQDARLGERVAVRNPRSGELYFAVASGSNEVTVHD